MKCKRSKGKGYQRQAAPRPASGVKGKEILNCIDRQRKKRVYRAAYRRGC